MKSGAPLHVRQALGLRRSVGSLRDRHQDAAHQVADAFVGAVGPSASVEVSRKAAGLAVRVMELKI